MTKQPNMEEELTLLTLNQLKEMDPGTLFATGFDPDIGWYAAVRGGIHDWAVYTRDTLPHDEPTYRGIANQGDKLHVEETIRRLVPCTDEAFAYYRH